jgi:hypothetical protein
MMPQAVPMNLIRWHYLWYVALALVIMIAAVTSNQKHCNSFSRNEGDQVAPNAIAAAVKFRLFIWGAPGSV